MKKNYFSTFFAALMLLVAMPATAQVSGLANLFGKYNFSATMEVTAEGESYRDKFSNDCVVTIEKDDYGYVVGYITGIAGLKGDMAINKITEDLDSITILSPNTYMGAEGLYLSDITGSKNISTGDDTQYGDIVYTYDPTTKTFTLPDFSLVTIKDKHYADKIVAKFTNVKLTFAGDVAVADLSGDWHFVAGDGEYDTMAGSTLPTVWDMTLTATDEFNKAYDVNFVLGDYAPLALTATFDGKTLLVAFDNAYLDVENMISLGDYYSAAAASEFEFELSNENELSLVYGMSIVGKVPSFSFLQYYGAGVATRSVAEEETFDWAGTYTVTVGEIVVENDAYTYPKTFEIEIVYDDFYGEYVITKFFGQDVTFNQYGWGMSAYPTATPDQIDLDLSLANGLVDLGGGTYLGMFDLKGDAGKIAFKEENGVVKIDDFQVMYYTDGNAPEFLAATYRNVTAVKKGSEGETGIENTIVENNSVEGIFDLLGRKLDAITAPGLYIVNGKKVVIK